MFDGIYKKKKIVAVDDDEICLSNIESPLQNEYEIYKMGSGNEVLDFLSYKKFVPDLILLDIVMPKMTGWQVFEKIKAIDCLKDVPIIFVTSLDKDETKERAFKTGAVDFIIKPYKNTVLQKRVKDVLKEW
jgi:putative two-component system response regulator